MYTFKNTEINNKRASDFETKAMLYLLGMRGDSKEIDLITVDCFNDVTGISEDFSKLWDVQSKNHGSLPPSKIGESLSTLYDNYISSISFFEYILFIPKLNRNYLKNEALHIYDYSNINDKQKKGIERKLKEKINRNTSGDEPPLFRDFLSKVLFVEDNKKSSTYIKRLSQFKSKSAVSENIYNRIFNEIRDAQTALKNSYIENEEIFHPSEVLKFSRHITKSEINTLLISRLVGIDIFSFPGIPTSFYPHIKHMDEEEIQDILQECNENLSRAFFNKNGCREFWQLSERIIKILQFDLTKKTQSVLDELNTTTKIKTPYLTQYTILYMISLIQTGLRNANKKDSVW
ncbi:hypothetical protein [Aeromonas veronii]|uniref:hypothetical protein n=1 Tax=Aeromonas veronii TaxID=654 RepID=UPI003D21DC38